MSILIIIDGLLMEGDSSPWSYCPDIIRLAAVGSGGILDLGPESACPEQGLVYRDILLEGRGGLPEKELPLGCLSALGLGINPDPQKNWASVALVHLFQKTNKLLFLSPERVGLTVDEKMRLLSGLEEEFNHQGWELHCSKEWGSAVISADNELSASCAPISILEGESFFSSLPQGADANNLLSLVTTGQMILARDPVNQQREKQQLLPLNSPWIWGLSKGNERLSSQLKAATQGRIWSSDSMVAGLGRLAGFAPAPLDEKNGLDSEWIEQVAQVASKAIAVVHFQTPAQLARMGMLEERQARLQQIDRQFITPLAARLSGEGGGLFVTTPAQLGKEGKPVIGAVPWLAARGRELVRKKRFWHRKTLGNGPSITANLFRKEWAA
jgi:hypothetical protein